MFAILVGFHNIFYAKSENAMGDQVLQILKIRNEIFCSSLLVLLRKPGAVLFVLIPDRRDHSDTIEIMNIHGGSVKTSLRDTLIPMLRFYLNRDLGERVRIEVSRDLSIFMNLFDPQERLWLQPEYLQRLLVTYSNDNPMDELLRRYKINHIIFHSSFINLSTILSRLHTSLPHAKLIQSSQSSHEQVEKKALVITDIDQTLLDNHKSCLVNRAVPNISVLVAIDRLCTELEKQGFFVRLMAMTARNQSVDARFAATNNPIAMRSVVEKVESVIQRPIEVHALWSYSSPFNEKGVKKTRKLEHLQSLFSANKIKMNYQIVTLFDDCEYECDSVFVSQIRSNFEHHYKANLLVFNVERNGYDDRDLELIDYLHEQSIDPTHFECIPMREPMAASTLAADRNEYRHDTQR